jgi:hypothetical protein
MGHATPTQRAGLKGLALRALGRNGVRNDSATGAEKTRNNGATLGRSNATAVATVNADLRARLLTIAQAEGIDAALVMGLPESELAATAEQVASCDPADQRIILRAYLHAVQETAERTAGRVPHGETARALCRGCGPVWVHPAVADAAPVIDGWPRLLGCPWCGVRHARKFVPRPSVQCGECRHFERDAINPAAGVGSCRIGHELQHGEPMHYPHATRQCPRFTP